MIRHRGPDDEGVWCDDDAGIGLAHRRLAIQDLSQAGHQPMSSACGRWVLVFNGEIYNHQELRELLEAPAAVGLTGIHAAPAWRGHSDTETILACFARWGLEQALPRLDGMFALALWDRQDHRLYLARDRIGEKPLYYGWIGAGLGFASEIKALRALPGFDRAISRSALTAYMSSNQVPAPLSIYEGIWKLLPGHWVVLTNRDLATRSVPPTHPYWELDVVARRGLASPFAFESDVAATNALESVLAAAVQAQMLSDVPLGAFLSGGIDSSTIVALMQAHSNRPVRTFSVGFHEDDLNEAIYAKAVARHLGTEHCEVYVDDKTARDVIPQLPELYCEPFADSSQIPTFLVAQLARQYVTVSLSGDGGDELFGGYGRYFLAMRIWAAHQRVPQALRPLLARAIRTISPQSWNTLLRALRPMIPARFDATLPGDRLYKGAEFLAARTFGDFYYQMGAHWSADTVLGAGGDSSVQDYDGSDLPQLELMMLRDGLRYLPDDILVKVDRAAMAVSLETRVPMLDRRVVEFAWELPQKYKVRGDQGKWLLRQVLNRHVPAELVDRPKMGFGVPIRSWLRGPLREWAEGLLDESRLRREGLLNPAPIVRRWQEHQSGQRNWDYHLWGALMFESWLENQS